MVLHQRLPKEDDWILLTKTSTATRGCNGPIPPRGYRAAYISEPGAEYEAHSDSSTYTLYKEEVPP